MKYADDVQAQNDNAGFDAVLTRALERCDDVTVPMNFASRVAAALAPPRHLRKRTQVGRPAAMVAALVLAIALFALAPHAAPSFGNWAFDFEMVAIAQLGGIGYWLTVRRGV